eukprot:CAMPEP_0170610514 /NCGR_PEP_ID=MMETSP0224-20130122/22701_1 /TAXON_ID=285029 /ORGANISM="Togula jolla, Strain CCCM 725" /LENGTH=135 /DNA_ID=CAMNT_0010935897 /DNA_START=45 /DNA_END=452 /DNA_ORIENTATION=-
MAAVTAIAPRAREGTEFAARPVLLNNPHGWNNVTRFATLSLAKLAVLERRVERGSASALGRALSKVESRHLREGFMSLYQNSSLDTFVAARNHAEDMLQRLHSLVDTFDLEVDHLVEDIVQSTLKEEATSGARLA